MQVDTDTGDIGKHGQDAYPKPGSPDRTVEHEYLNGRAEARARFEVHSETDHDVLGPEWAPGAIERAIAAAEELSPEAFDDAFREYHRLLGTPTRLVGEYGLDRDVTDPSVVLVYRYLCVDNSGSPVDIPDGVRVEYADMAVEDRTPRFGGVEPTCPGRAAPVPVVLAPFKKAGTHFSYPEEFRNLVTRNLVCQVRDTYRHMGMDVPPRFRVEGFGKPPHRLNVGRNGIPGDM